MRQHGIFHPLCAVFLRYARKDSTPTKIKERSAEGKNVDRVRRVIEINSTKII
jgi:hypothetical protein